jgi:endonuclease-8
MPEGDTVWLAGRRLHDALAGHRLTGTDFRVPQLATTDLTGRVVSAVVSRGKHLLTRIDDDLTLHTHFRMDGTWHLYRPGTRWRGGPDWQVRVVLATDQWQAVGYRLPVVDLIARGDEHQVVGHLGPDLLGDDWDLDEALRRLRADPDREIGEALIDQRNLAGIGNAYKAESLFVSRLSPWCPVRNVPDLAGVVENARRLLTISRQPRQQHWVYQRAGKPCRRCRSVVQVAKQGIAPFDRLTYWCPACQPA